MSEIIEVRNLVKVFGEEVRAVDGITFSVREGEIFGFLGPNGAGKTTTIRILVALLRRTSGDVLVAGFDPAKQGNEVRKRIGYAAQAIALDDDLTGAENLALIGKLNGMTGRHARQRADELLSFLDLSEAGGRRAGTYSGGMRRRLDLAGALVHSPPLLILDEPTTGLDPQTRMALWAHLENLRREGSTILVTTQYMEEADRLSDRVGIIDHGHLMALGSPDDLKADIGSDVVTVLLHEVEDRPAQIEKIEAILRDLRGLSEMRHDDQSVAAYVPDGAQSMVEVVRRLDSAGIDPAGLTLSTPSLDDVFLKHTGSRMRVEEVKPPPRVMMGRRRRQR